MRTLLPMLEVTLIAVHIASVVALEAQHIRQADTQGETARVVLTHNPASTG